VVTVCCAAVQAVRDILLLGHRQAFTWIDEWYGKYHGQWRENLSEFDKMNT